MKNYAIKFDHVSKSFSRWNERPKSIKSILSQILRFDFKFGETVRKQVLENISFEVKKGDFIGLMGRNGAGKSTLLKMISNIYHPTSGKIDVNGSLVPLLELGAGFASELNAIENIYLNSSILGFSKKFIDSKVEKIIEFSELGDNIYKSVQNYSSGMLVRLGFSIAAHLEADILLFDEILAVGDVGFQKKCLAKIEELYSTGKTIILVTHSPSQVLQFCNRCIVFEKHGIIFDGDPKVGTKKYEGLF